MKTYEREGINYFWSIKNSTEILNKLKAKGFQASTISTYDYFSTLYTTLPHDLNKNQLVDLIEKIRLGVKKFLYGTSFFSLPKKHKKYYYPPAPFAKFIGPRMRFE